MQKDVRLLSRSSTTVDAIKTSNTREMFPGGLHIIEIYLSFLMIGALRLVPTTGNAHQPRISRGSLSFPLCTISHVSGTCSSSLASCVFNYYI